MIGGNSVRMNRPGQANMQMPTRVSFFRELRVYPSSFAFR
jgi:hypothetical protein